MFIIDFKGFGNSIRGKTLWHVKRHDIHIKPKSYKLELLRELVV